MARAMPPLLVVYVHVQSLWLFSQLCPDADCMLPQCDMPLLVHGEVTDPAIDFFDREAVFIERVLEPLLQRQPDLRVCMEHITTKQVGCSAFEPVPVSPKACEDR